jgi:hypothetical protein
MYLQSYESLNLWGYQRGRESVPTRVLGIDNRSRVLAYLASNGPLSGQFKPRLRWVLISQNVSQPDNSLFIIFLRAERTDRVRRAVATQSEAMFEGTGSATVLISLDVYWTI